MPFWKKDFSKKKAASLEQSELEEAGSSSSSSQVIADNDIAYIIHVTAEMAPLAKVGGLGDVVTGLARACIGRGHKVEVMLPFYEAIPRDQIEDLVAVDSYSSYHRGEWVPIQLYRGNVSGVPVLFLEPKNNRFFKGTAIYGGSYDDELEAYLFFSRACLEWMQVCASLCVLFLSSVFRCFEMGLEVPGFGATMYLKEADNPSAQSSCIF